MAKTSYAKMFTKRKDGYYQKKVNGKTLYDKDPEALYYKWQASLRPLVPTFRQAAELYETKVREHLQEKTWMSYRPIFNDLVSTFGDMACANITAADVFNTLQIAKSKGYSATVIITKKTIFNQIMNEALLAGWIQINPVLSVRNPTNLKHSIRHAPTEAEMQIIAKNASTKEGFLIYFLFCTGLRRGEALALTKRDIDWNKNEISITKALSYVSNANPILKSTKTDSSTRAVPIISSLRPLLRKHVQTTEGDILFPSPKIGRNPGGGYMTEECFKGIMRRYCKETGLNITAHMLRHGTATLLFESGVDVYTAKSLLGHSNINTTMQVYTELRDNQRKKSIDKFDDAMKAYKKV